MKIILTFSAILMFTITFSQVNEGELKKLEENTEHEIDSFLKIDFLKKKYVYLDEDFNISIDSTYFNEAIKKFKFHKSLINNYNDSLSVVLTYELNSVHGSRIAVNNITYKWGKIGYYLWETAEDSKILANKLGFEHPYRFYEYLINDTIKSKEKLALFNDLKLKIKKRTNEDLNILPYKKFIYLAFQINPDRLEAIEKYINENKKHKH